MSVRFNAAADRLFRTANLPNYDSNYTVVFSFYFETRPQQSEYRTLFSINRDSATDAAETLVLFGLSTSDTRLRIWAQSFFEVDYSELYGSTNLSPGTWYTVALVRSANNARTVYLATPSSLFAQEISFTSSFSGRSAPTRMELGGYSTSNLDAFDGRIDGVMLWTEARSLAELQAQRFSLRFPLYFANLAGYWPMASGSGERARDYSGLGRDWTEGGTLTDEDAGPFYYPVWPYGGHVAAPAVGQSIAPSFIAGGSQVFSPTVSTQPNGSIAPNLIPGTAQIFTPSLSGQASGSITPGFIVGGSQVFAPTVSRQNNLSVSPLFTPARLPGMALRFYGNTPSNQDKARIELDSPANPPIDVGASDATYEFWIRARYADNTSSNITDARYSNIILDRDIWGHARGWVLGVTRRTGPILAVCWAVSDTGGGWATAYGSADVGDDVWHHVALTWQQGTRVLEVYVDGVSQGTLTISESNLSYPDGVRPGSGANNEYLVVGGEKHGVGVAYNGLFDELRVSNVRRYTAGFTRPSAPFATDGVTVGLFHFDEGTGTVVYDFTGLNGAENAEILVGGAPQGPAWTLSSAPIGTQIFTPTLQSSSQSIAPSFISSTAQVFPPSLSVQANGSVAPTLIAGEAQVFTPSLSQQPNGSIGANFIPGAAQTFTPSLLVQSNSSIAPNFIASGAQVFAPTVSLQSSGSIAPTFIAGNSQVFAQTLATQPNGSIAPALIAGSPQVFSPMLSQGGDQSIVLTFIAGDSQVFSPTVSIQPNGSISPTFVQSQTQVFTLTVSAQSNISISPVFMAGASQAFTPSLSQQGNGSIALSLIPSTAQIFTPSLSSQASGSITPGFIAGGSQVFTPFLSDGSLQQIVVPFIPGQSVVYPPILFLWPGYPLVAEVQTTKVVAEVQTMKVGV